MPSFNVVKGLRKKRWYAPLNCDGRSFCRYLVVDGIWISFATVLFLSSTSNFFSFYFSKLSYLVLNGINYLACDLNGGPKAKSISSTFLDFDFDEWSLKLLSGKLPEQFIDTILILNKLCVASINEFIPPRAFNADRYRSASW